MYAGHLPTMHFDLAEWQAMPVAAPDDGSWPGEGFHRVICRGRPVVVYGRYLDYEHRSEVDFAVRPIVRVKMGRRVVTDAQQMIYEFLCCR